ncbi:hypothetical protein FA10DRAFT_264287 [Acaromyces ingoldii]|uniref:Uncharacterized protein n=1 Tax=Acaromyces ingoldii TaxID=215250 RepID=A0A316YX29_9BASI|nr:hypothetical protein FA10DRAFT_264287 [Acaromyces ingoldii]PWN93662.1 hypothetical protein FA10DRAFT_264287 [Acaromyces ingoldii]
MSSSCSSQATATFFSTSTGFVTGTSVTTEYTTVSAASGLLGGVQSSVRTVTTTSTTTELVPTSTAYQTQCTTEQNGGSTSPTSTPTSAATSTAQTSLSTISASQNANGESVAPSVVVVTVGGGNQTAYATVTPSSTPTSTSSASNSGSGGGTNTGAIAGGVVGGVVGLVLLALLGWFLLRKSRRDSRNLDDFFKDPTYGRRTGGNDEDDGRPAGGAMAADDPYDTAPPQSEYGGGGGMSEYGGRRASNQLQFHNFNEQPGNGGGAPPHWNAAAKSAAPAGAAAAASLASPTTTERAPGNAGWGAHGLRDSQGQGVLGRAGSATSQRSQPELIKASSRPASMAGGPPTSRPNSPPAMVRNSSSSPMTSPRRQTVEIGATSSAPNTFSRGSTRHHSLNGASAGSNVASSPDRPQSISGIERRQSPPLSAADYPPSRYSHLDSMWRTPEEAAAKSNQSTPTSLGPATPANGAAGILAPPPITLDQEPHKQLEQASLVTDDDDDEAQHWLKPETAASAAAIEAYHKTMVQTMSQKRLPSKTAKQFEDEDEAHGIALANKLWGNEARRLVLTNAQPVATP